MAKTTGLGDRLFVSGVDLSGDTQSASRIGGGPSPLVMTGIDKSAFERQGGLLDGALTWTSFFNPTNAHPTLSALPTADVLLSYLNGVTLGNASASMVAKQINYDGTRATDGSFLFGLNALPNGFGIEWGRQQTAGIRTDTAATNGTGVDWTAGTTFGLQAYLHVFTGFVGTSVTVKLQHSTDNGGGDPYADVTGGGFTAATGVTSQRIQTATNLTIKQWIRAVTTGTFSNAAFFVQVSRNFTAPVV